MADTGVSERRDKPLGASQAISEKDSGGLWGRRDVGSFRTRPSCHATAFPIGRVSRETRRLLTEG